MLNVARNNKYQTLTIKLTPSKQKQNPKCQTRRLISIMHLSKNVIVVDEKRRLQKLNM